MNTGPDTAVQLCQLRRASWLAAWAVCTYVVFQPIIKAPLLADDFLAPFTDYRNIQGQWSQVFPHSWNIISGGVSFRPLATLLTSVQNYVTVEIGLRGILSPDQTFSLLRFGSYLFIIDSFARLVCCLPNNREVKHRGTVDLQKLRIVVTFAFGALTQIHILWSNDPVTNYLLSGLVPMGVMLHFLRYGLKYLDDGGRGSAYMAAAMGIVGSLLYELTLGVAIGFASYILAKTFWTSHELRRHHLLVASTALPNMLVVVGGRFVYRDNAAAYGGTTIGRSGSSPEVALIHLLGNVPGSAWRLSREVEKHVFNPTQLTVAVAIIGGLVAYRFGNAVPKSKSNWVVGVALGASAVIPAILLSMTAKVQAETTRVGQVYIPYVYGLPLGAFLLLLGMSRSLRNRTLRLLAVIVFAGVLGIQQTINLNLSQHASGAYRANTELLATWTSNPPQEVRCEALSNWKQIPWPEYYRAELEAGLSASFFNFHRQVFC